MAYVYKKRSQWYAGYKNEVGKHAQYATDARTKTEAQRIADELERRAERIRLGLEAAPPPKTTFAELAKLYLADVAPLKRSEDTIEARIRLHLLPAFAETAIDQIGVGEIQALLTRKRKDLAPQTVEHLRRTLQAMFSYALKAKFLVGENPAAEVPHVQVPKKPVHFLDAADVPRVLAAVPEQWRVLFATAVFTGARKGELLGLKVSDVDLGRRLIHLTSSYDGPTKSAKPRSVPIPDELLPFLKAHIDAAPGTYLFGGTTGEMRNRNTDLARIFKTALVKAGLITGYEHVCRRVGCGFKEQRKDGEVTKCPKCNFRLWPNAIPVDLRFHDLRSTFGTHAYERTGDVRFVQTVLGHHDPKLTEERYSAVRAQGLLANANKLTFNVPAPAVSYPVLTAGSEGKKKPGIPDEELIGIPGGFVGGVDGTRTRGLRRDRPNPGDGAVEQSSASLGKSSTSEDVNVAPIGRFEQVSAAVSYPILTQVSTVSSAPDRPLLTVRQVAALLNVCTKTVYEMCASGRLRHVRVMNAIRVRPRDLVALASAAASGPERQR